MHLGMQILLPEFFWRTSLKIRTWVPLTGTTDWMFLMFTQLKRYIAQP